MRWPAPVLRDAANLGFQTLGRIQRAATGDAGAAIGDETGVDPWRDVVIEEVMNDSITEVSRPHLAGLWPRDDKADRFPWRIRSTRQFLVQRPEIALQVLLKRYGAP